MWREEGRAWPYVVDLFDKAAEGLGDRDILVYTNTDICVCSKCALLAVAALQGTEAFYSMRRDFNEDFTEPIPDDVVPRGDAYVGSDLYGMRVSWWQRHRKEFPDMIVGLEGWDAVLRSLIELTNPGRLVSIPNTHYHRRHASFWESAENRYRLKGQKFVLDRARSWLRGHGLNPANYGIAQI